MGSTGDLKFKTISDYDSTHYHNRNKTTIINNREPAQQQEDHGGTIYIGSGMGSDQVQ